MGEGEGTRLARSFLLMRTDQLFMFVESRVVPVMNLVASAMQHVFRTRVWTRLVIPSF